MGGGWVLAVDEKLIKQAIKGDAAAVAEVLAAVEGVTYNICLRMLKHPQDAADAAQDALLKIYLGLKGFRREAGFSSWVYRIATNASLDYIRRNKRQRAVVSLSDGESFITEALETDAGPEERAMERDMHEEMLAALAQIDPGQRAALVLLEYAGLGYEEIAGVLSISLGTVKSRIFRGRRALAKALNSDGEAGQAD
ncbi:sigma-70 family RNA polymerase sigma factor [Eubacteriales bacterium OttesenSCG-928-M02]|nr:sigma-70 family RNA polymerase sigma factor [Eubacteriales bacterium OttesenSCG-928-M02]